MAKRLTTRLSAGAALVTGLGMIGLAAAVPAHADTDLVYSCTTPIGPQSFDISLSATDTDTATVGDTVTLTPSGTLTLNEGVSNAMAGALGWHYVEGDVDDIEATVSNGSDQAPVTTDLSITRTHIWTGTSWVQDSTPDLPITGTGGEVVADQAGTYTVSAPTTFSATFRGYDADQVQVGEAIDSTCTYVSGVRVIDSITVSDEPTTPPSTTSSTTSSTSSTTTSSTSEPTAETNDWFSEPSTLPITEDGKRFTVAGTAEQAGTVQVLLLDGDKQVLRTITWEVTRGSNTRDFAFAEGTDYVRLVSQDCVDSEGRDESVAGGCNVEYYAPWTNPDSSTTDDGETPAGGPETPGVVQTDGFTRAEAPTSDSTAAVLLGGALLAGAGAGTVVLARRRLKAQH